MTLPPRLLFGGTSSAIRRSVQGMHASFKSFGLGLILSVLLVYLILVAQFHLLTAIGLRGLMGMLALLLASLAAGWLLGGSDAPTRRTMMLTTALRNVGVGLVDHQTKRLGRRRVNIGPRAQRVLANICPREVRLDAR